MHYSNAPGKSPILTIIAVLILIGDSFAGNIEKWADYFQPSAPSREDIVKGLHWFKDASKPFRGKNIKSAAENHRGEMAVESRLGAGTKFTICLPLEGKN